MLVRWLNNAPGPVLAELEITPGALLLTVWDSSTALPVAHAKDPQRIGRHGLGVIRALTQTLTFDVHSVGKRITAHIPCPPALCPRTALARHR